jgi:hypothetical protein
MNIMFQNSSFHYNGSVRISKVLVISSPIAIGTSSINKPTIKRITTHNPVLK